MQKQECILTFFVGIGQMATFFKVLVKWKILWPMDHQSVCWIVCSVIFAHNIFRVNIDLSRIVCTLTFCVWESYDEIFLLLTIIQSQSLPVLITVRLYSKVLVGKEVLD